VSTGLSDQPGSSHGPSQPPQAAVVGHPGPDAPPALMADTRPRDGSPIVPSAERSRRDAAALIARIRVAHDEDEKAALMRELLNPPSPRVLAFVNQHAVNLSWELRELWSDLAAADVLLRDGIGVKKALAWLGREPGLNLNGTDLIPQILLASRGRRVALYGTRTPWTERAAAAVESFGIEVVSTLDGFHSDLVYLADAREHPADMIVLGMGMPKQERVARLLRAHLSSPTLIVCGGATLDFLGGRVRRAPLWVRRADLEWLFRLALEPRRLWGRYGPGGIRFVMRMRRTVATIDRIPLVPSDEVPAPTVPEASPGGPPTLTREV
jgi:N-acetylglucosaminyldiphosphoundecaprenol N-acetyl-beta-D-mannosaminyltransferase